jgi:hypothetical protein
MIQREGGGESAPQWNELLKGLDRSPGASEATLAKLEAAVGSPLSTAYRQLLAFADGAYGDTGVNSILIYRSDQIMEDPFPYGSFFPGFLFFGSDGGAAMFGFDLAGGSDGIFVMHVDDLDRKQILQLSPTLVDFLDLMQRSSWIDRWAELIDARQ